MKKTSYLMLAMLLSIITIQATQAQISFQWEKEGPRNFNFTQESGTTTNHSLTLRNTGDNPTSIVLYATDGTTTHRGSFTTKPLSVEQTNIGKWITTAEKKITLGPKETKEIQYTINIPEFTPPGTYSGGFSLENVKDESINLNQTGVKTYSRVVTTIFLKIPGEKIIDYSWNKFNYSKNDASFIFSLTNNGNVQLETTGSITIDGINHKDEITLGKFILMPEQDLSSEIKWQKRPSWGYFTATANMDIIDPETDELLESLTKSVSFFIIPTGFIILLLLLILLITGLIVGKKMLQKNAMKNSTTYIVKDGETLMTIAGANKLNWKKIAKLNHIQPPYSLSSGQTIHIPKKKA